jgi:hypothetical protein
MTLTDIRAPGWEPLCHFLGAPVPEGESFPHVNNAADFTRRQHEQYQIIARALLPALGVVTAAALVVVLSRRFGKRSARG